jgi:hypothetical protein
MPRMHSADGEPEHEPHTVTDDSTVCVADDVANKSTDGVAFAITEHGAECEPDGISHSIAINFTDGSTHNRPKHGSECGSECESDGVAISVTFDIAEHGAECEPDSVADVVS